MGGTSLVPHGSISLKNSSHSVKISIVNRRDEDSVFYFDIIQLKADVFFCQFPPN